MKIALLGYGKMGKIIEEEAHKRGHEIALIITSANAHTLDNGILKGVDIAIEFTQPGSVLNNIYHCFDAGIPIVVGTTGWLQHWNQVVEDARCRHQTLFYASNFSLGVNLFFQLNTVLAKMMNEFPEYEVSMTEIHHTQKKDSPSGTAISLTESILEYITRKKGWINILEGMAHKEYGIQKTESSEDQALNPSPISIESFRKENVPGIHEVRYSSEEDVILIRHEAKNRKGFAVGAVLSAEWVLGKTGVFTMKDLIGF